MSALFFTVLSVVGSLVVLNATEDDVLIDSRYDWATSRAAAQGFDPYDSLEAVGRMAGVFVDAEFSHPRTPGALLLQQPLGAIPSELVDASGRVLLAAEAVLVAWVVAKLGAYSFARAAALAPGFFLLLPGQWLAEFGGQALAVVFLVGASWVMAMRSDRFAAGVPLGAAVALKLHPWLIVLAFWLSGKRRAAVGAVLSFALLNFLGVLLPGVRLDRALEALTSATGFVDFPQNASVSGLLGVAPFYSIVAAVAVMAASTAVTRRLDHLVAIAIPLSLVLSPLFWPAYAAETLLSLAALRAPWKVWFGLIGLWALYPLTMTFTEPYVLAGVLLVTGWVISDAFRSQVND